MILLKKLNSKGYTLIELMLAMGLFSVILVVSTIGFIGINRTYTRGVIKKQLSESIQKLSSDIETTLQIEPSSPVVFCSGADGPPNCTTQEPGIIGRATRAQRVVYTRIVIYVAPIPSI